MQEDKIKLFNKARLDDRQVSELIGLSHGLIADGILNDAEIDHLYKWLAANYQCTENPVVNKLFLHVDSILADGIIDEEERNELFETLMRFAGGDFEIGEAQKSSTLPLDSPAPEIVHADQIFTFTGTFTFGRRKECEAACSALGGIPKSLTQKTDYLVIGEYATESWANSSFGRKIEKAIEFQGKGLPLKIVSEHHWRSFL